MPVAGKSAEGQVGSEAAGGRPRLNKNWPRLLPQARWARLALLLLVVFTLCRGVLWASIQPAWFAADEDYHWLYIEYVLIEKSLPDLQGPFYTGELYNAALFTRQGAYEDGPRTRYRGSPRDSLRRLETTFGQRKADGQPPRQVLHPPLYHLGGVLADRLVTGEVAPVRLTVIRYYGVLLGAVLVWLSWLLAAQVLSRTWHQFAAAAVVATQPGLAFASARVGNDILTACTFTAVLAWLAWMLRAPPDRRQGYLLGVLLAAAALTKATSLALLPLTAVALLLIWMSHRASGAEVWRVALRATALFVVLTGWWWVVVLLETGSPLGNRGALTGILPFDGTGAAGILATLQLGALDFGAAGEWIRDAYRTYWIHQFPYEVRPEGFWYFAPLGAACVATVGLARMAWRERRSLRLPDRPLLRLTLLLLLAPLALTLPFFAVDMLRASDGLSFLTASGRFSLPAASAAAVLFVLGLTQLAAGRRRVQVLLVAGGVALSFANYAVDFGRWAVERHYGDLGDLGDTLRHATWDKPAWVTEGFLIGTASLACAAFLAAWLVAAVGARSQTRAPR